MPIVRRTRLFKTVCGVCLVVAHGAHCLRPSSTRSQPTQPGKHHTHSLKQSCSPDDGHNDARNMLRIF